MKVGLESRSSTSCLIEGLFATIIHYYSDLRNSKMWKYETDGYFANEWASSSELENLLLSFL
jgi:hypothetical protein